MISASGVIDKQPIHISYFDKFLFLYKDKQADPICFMDLMFCKAKSIRIEKKLGNIEPLMYGVRIIKDDKFEEIISYDLKQSDKLISFIEKWAVFNEFSNYYSQIEGVGGGFYAKVFSVYRNFDKKKFAVKAYDKNREETKKNSYMILYEISLLRSIASHNYKRCLNIHKVYEGRNYIYYLTDLYKGGELSEALLNTNGICEYTILRIVKNLIEILNFLEKQNIVHRDIKPQNIVLRKEHKITDIVLVDFGFAAKCDDIVKSNESKIAYSVGTPGFIAPEIIAGGKVDTRVDVFSAGCVLYYLMSAVYPFTAPNKDDLLQKNYDCKPDYDFETSFECNYCESLVDLVKKMMTRNPKDRPLASELINHAAMKELDKINKKIELDPLLKRNLIEQSIDFDESTFDDLDNHSVFMSNSNLHVENSDKNIYLSADARHSGSFDFTTQRDLNGANQKIKIVNNVALLKDINENINYLSVDASLKLRKNHMNIDDNSKIEKTVYNSFTHLFKKRKFNTNIEELIHKKKELFNTNQN